MKEEKIKEPVLIIPQLIVGLGNPEPKYDQTRHNIGFAAIDVISHAWKISLTENRKFQGQFGEGMTIGSHKVRLLKPLTYMNRSGQAVQAVTSWYKLLPESVLVIYDDLDLPLGKTRLRLSGSAGGHNGMKSIISHINSQNFPRLRIGIGKPKGTKDDAQNGDNSATVSHVLGKFTATENQVMSQVLNFVVDCLEMSCKQGVEKAMNICNSRNFEVSES